MLNGSKIIDIYHGVTNSGVPYVWDYVSEEVKFLYRTEFDAKYVLPYPEAVLNCDIRDPAFYNLTIGELKHIAEVCNQLASDFEKVLKTIATPFSTMRILGPSSYGGGLQKVLFELKKKACGDMNEFIIALDKAVHTLISDVDIESMMNQLSSYLNYNAESFKIERPALYSKCSRKMVEFAYQMARDQILAA